MLRVKCKYSEIVATDQELANESMFSSFCRNELNKFNYIIMQESK